MSYCSPGSWVCNCYLLRGSGHLKYMQSYLLLVFRPPAVHSSLWTSTALFWLLSQYGNFHPSQSRLTPPSVPDQPFCGTVWGAFQSVSEDEVNKIPNQSTIKTCELDPLPASFLTHCLDDLLPHLTSIINDSLHSGLFPSAFTSAIVKPLLRKTTLNTEILKNYGPVPNLSFLSKILEKVVFRQLSSHLLTNILFCFHQSAYHAGHSTERVLLKIVNDLLSALDEDKVSLLDLVLDLSAAFGAIDHSILLSRLSYSFAISDTVLAWFTSYLIVRTQIISVNGSKSLPAPILKAFPRDLS